MTLFRIPPVPTDRAHRRDADFRHHFIKSLKMIKLFSLKQQKKDEESAGGNRTGAGGKKASAAQLRIQKGRLVNSTSTG